MTDKIVKADATPLALATMTETAPAEFVRSALFDMNQTPFTLGQIKVPSGGATTWTIETLEGETEVKELDVVVLAIRSNLRKWYRADFGGDDGGPPSCSSADGVNGFGVTTREPADGEQPTINSCGTCPWNEWGSHRQGRKGKDCAEFAIAVVLRLDSLLPSVLSIPTGSLGGRRGTPAGENGMTPYGRKLMEAGKFPWGVVTRLTLDKNVDGNLKWSTINFKYQRDLTPEECERLDGVAPIVKDWLAAADFGGAPAASSQG